MTSPIQVPPGFWVRDDHIAGPRGALMDSVWQEAFNDGFARGFARDGVPARGLVATTIAGWGYISFQPLADPDEVRERTARSAGRDLFTEHETAARRWLSEWLPAAEQERCALQAGVEDLDDRALADRLDAVASFARRLVTARFADVGIGTLVADYVLHAEQAAGWDEATALARLGGVAASAALAHRVAALATAVATDAPDTAAAILAGAPVELASLGDVRSLEPHLDEVIAPSPLAPRLRERPDLVVAMLRAHLAGGQVDDTGSDPLPRELAAHGDRARLAQRWRDETQGLLLRILGTLRHVALAAGELVTTGRRLDAPELALDLTADELTAALRGTLDPRATARARADDRHSAAADPPPPTLGSPPAPPPGAPTGPASRYAACIQWLRARLGAPAGPPRATDRCLAGVAVGGGVLDGVARIVVDLDDVERVAPGEIVVCPTTAPAWNPVLAVAGAVVCDTGGALCHTALIARELGIPAVVGVKVATTAIPDGARVQVDGTAGTVRVTAR